MSKTPSLYLDSKLFHRPSRDDRDTTNIGKDQDKKIKFKAIPQEGLEPLEPEDDDSLSSDTRKALDIIKSRREPDTTGELEGKFKVSLQKMIDQLNKVISAEYSQWFRWYHYALVLRGHARDGLANEFEEHAEEELEHAEKIAMRVVGLGGYPTTEIKQPESLEEVEEILKEMLIREQEGMKLYRETIDMCGDNVGTRTVLEANTEIEQEHIDDLWRYLENPDRIKKAGADQESAGRDIQSEGQAKRAYEHSFSRVAPGISGGTTPDLPERGRDWDGDVPGVPDEPQEGRGSSLDRKPKKFLGDDAQKALAGAPRFARGPLVPPMEAQWLQMQGYPMDDILSGRVTISPRQRAAFNKFMTATVQKSISGLGGLSK